MKVLLFLPFVLIASSCLYPEPYAPPRSPYRQGGGAYPYGARGPQAAPDAGDYGGETGRYEPVPGNGPTSPSPQAENRPSAPRIDDDFDPAPDGPAPQAPPKKEYPTAEASDKPGVVVSPYPPYNKISVEDFKSGQLAKDPSNGKIFRVP
jgi:hypothetical protein